MVLTRRQMLQAAVAAGMPFAMGASSVKRRPPTSSTPFQVPMPIPAVLRPSHRSATTDYYDLDIQTARAEILRGRPVPVITFNGKFPGPTIHAHAGRRTIVRQHNKLSEEANVHLHGGVVSQDNDGLPMDVIAPGTSRTYVYPNSQVAASLWYHDHAHHLESEHVYRGLAGFYLLSDAHEQRLSLPEGPYDVPIMIRDAELAPDGSLVYDEDDFFGRTTILVNGKPQPYFRVAARKYRFRLLNGANLRPFELNLSTGDEFVQIGSDRGLLETPWRTTMIPLSPAERADVIVDFSRYPLGTQVVLRNSLFATDTTTDVMRFDVVRPAPDRSRIPERLATLPLLQAPSVTRKFTLLMDPAQMMGTINGKPFDMNRIDTVVKYGASEVWEITNINTDGAPHNFHVHLVDFRVLDINGRPPDPGQTGLKDTVRVMPGETVRILTTFDFQYTGTYVYHCHMMDHSSMGLMAQLRIDK
ncbi:multicopper oxidase family protein [Amycolatopsis sp. NPDC049868]|uniref:multicopper oxidase family protein n=1 Tax=Amycolatopsis sp. NPDC049868 TaxID=3363934 RepID=UPI0037B6E50E